MMIRKVAAIGACVVSAALGGMSSLSGCSSSSTDCQSQCESAAPCFGQTKGLTNDQIASECETLCKDEQTEIDAAKCQGPNDDLQSCISGLSNICDAKTTCTETNGQPETCTGPCAKEHEALDTCTQKFCANPANAPKCHI